MAFGPGGAYFLSGAAAQRPYGGHSDAFPGTGGGYSADGLAAANQRSALLPAYLPKGFSAAPFAATMPGLQEGGSCTVRTAGCHSTWLHEPSASVLIKCCGFHRPSDSLMAASL